MNQGYPKTQTQIYPTKPLDTYTKNNKIAFTTGSQILSLYQYHIPHATPLGHRLHQEELPVQIFLRQTIQATPAGLPNRQNVLRQRQHGLPTQGQRNSRDQ